MKFFLERSLKKKEKMDKRRGVGKNRGVGKENYFFFGLGNKQKKAITHVLF